MIISILRFVNIQFVLNFIIIIDRDDSGGEN